VNFYLGGIMIEEQIKKIGIIKDKLKTGEVLSKDEYDFCRMNTRIFENLRFKKVRRAMKKWQQ
jgi:hypothetical protein